MDMRLFRQVVFAGGILLSLGVFAGAGWEVLPIYGGGRILDVFFTRNPQVLYAVSDVGGPYRTDDGGLSWRPLHVGYPYAWRVRQMNKAYTLNVDPRDENSVIAGCGDDPKHPGGILVTRDGGKTWKEAAIANFRANAPFRKTTGRTIARNPFNPDELVAGADGSGLLRSRTNGNVWKPLGLDGRYFTCIHYDENVEGRIWAAAPGYEDIPGEARWMASGRIPHPVPRTERERGFYRSDDGGATWARLEIGRIPTEFAQVKGDPWLVGIFDECRVKRSRDGVHWEDFHEGLPELPPGTQVWDNWNTQKGNYQAISAGDGFWIVADTRGNCFTRGVNDAAWKAAPMRTAVASDPVCEPNVRAFMPQTTAVVVDPRDPKHWLSSDWYTIWETTDAGENWHTRIRGIQQICPFVLAASPFDAQTLFYGAADNPLYVSHDGGKSFRHLHREGPLAESVNAVAFSRVTEGLALVCGGKFAPCVRRTRDNGRTWEICAQKGLPVQKPDLAWSVGDGFHPVYSVVAHPNADVFYAAAGGWVGAGKGGVYRSTDAGETWEWFGEGLEPDRLFFKMMEFGNGNALAVSESGDLVCWGMDGKKVYRRGPSDDRWTKIDFTMTQKAGRGTPAVTAVPGKPGWFVADKGNDEAALFLSRDGGRTFERQWLMSGEFQRVACDPFVPGLLYAAGTDAVYVSRDYGAHFAVLPGGFGYPCDAEPTLFADRGRLWATVGGSGCFVRRVCKWMEE